MENKLQAGFARAEISPTVCSVPLGGFGATEFRLSGVIGDPLYVNAVAIRSGEETILYLSLDMLGVLAKHVEIYREAVSEKTGIPKNRIFITASHTHSGPCPRSEIPNAVKYRIEQLIPALVEFFLGVNVGVEGVCCYPEISAQVLEHIGGAGSAAAVKKQRRPECQTFQHLIKFLLIVTPVHFR